MVALWSGLLVICVMSYSYRGKYYADFVTSSRRTWYPAVLVIERDRRCTYSYTYLRVLVCVVYGATTPVVHLIRL